MSEPLLRRAGLLPELSDDGEQAIQLQVDVPIEAALEPVVAALGQIVDLLQKIDMRLHRIEQMGVGDPARVV